MKTHFLFIFCFQLIVLAAVAQTVGKNGFVSIEMESTTSPLGAWKKISQGELHALPGASGGVHLEMTGNTPSGGGGANSPLQYPFTVDVTGKYRMVMRASKRLDGAPGDYCNDAVVKLAGNFTSANHFTTDQMKNWIKFYGGNPHPSIGWCFKMDINHSQPYADYNLIAGESYVFSVAGRSQRFSPDFFVFFNLEMYDTDLVMGTENFFPNSNETFFNIETSRNVTEGGSITGAGSHRQDQNVTITAIPTSCYKFDNWTENDVVVSTTAKYTFKVTQARNLKANFSKIVLPVVAEPVAGGTITGDMQYVCGDLVKVTATPNEGYNFLGWYAGSSLITNQLYAEINVDRNFQLIAKFIPVNPQEAYLVGNWTFGPAKAKEEAPNRLLVVAINGEFNPISSFSITGVTYGGQPMTKRVDTRIGSTFGNLSYFFTLNEAGIADANQSGAIAITWASSVGSVDNYDIFSAFYGNVDQAVPVRATSKFDITGTLATAPAVTTGVGDVVLMGASFAGSNRTPDYTTGFTQILKNPESKNWGDGIIAYKAADGSGQVIPSITNSNLERIALTAIVVKRNTTTNTRNIDAVNAVKITPNPTSDFISISFDEAVANREIKLFNSVGQLVFRSKVEGLNTQINLKSLNLNGLVVLQVLAGNETSNHKIVVN
jgi:hypothetical protein